MELDRIDLALLRALLADGRATQVELADRVGLSATACGRRVQRLEQAGLIAGYQAVLDQRSLGYSAVIMVTITLDRQSEDYLSAFEVAMQRCPNVVSCFLMSGGSDYLLHVLARDIADFERIHKEQLSRLPGVARIHSSFAIREVVRRGIPLEGRESE
jgi:Lrp/AsnC family transcriptional regulator, leucine-responsive regulatory protein